MFKFSFYDGDKSAGSDGDRPTGHPVTRLAIQEHPVPASPLLPSNEVSTLSLCGHQIKLLNGDQVILRLEREGAAGDLSLALKSHTDLIPDVYEGGMKLWECSQDLVAYLDAHVPLAGLRVTELGCGAALPAVFCLLRGAAAVTVQDYNREVVDHLTIPNMRLNVTATQLAGCRALSGDWGALAALLRTERRPGADLVLTSETIYSRESWARLLEAVDAALAPAGSALVAAKTCYFGVGGGTRAFEQAVLEDGRFSSEVVFATQQGLQREILRLKRC
ncbi:histidine protein methyltransferase 1 homolog [Pollicipes pollicipes]|uniref:histidine protein methyltransferase 1 homolog n=1 Tax=Pollicipes pollicipes TaxID=41117 RepID=UPI0018855FE7|nr:histidine protein methyltransferase 1 homolog [Pollicipes pollicipes]